MSPSRLSIKINYVENSIANDPLERSTSAELEVFVDWHNITRVWDRLAKEERSYICVPVFPIAEWIVENWWTLLNEPCPTQRVPVGDAVLRNLPWVKRHNMRSADSSLYLPALYFFNDGEFFSIQWLSDDDKGQSNLPIEYVDRGQYYLSRKEIADSLAELVNSVLAHVKNITNSRVTELASHWQAIQDADAEEANFCILAGRMGLNPYDVNETTDTVAAAICTIEGDSDLPLVRDLTEATTVDVVASEWSWVQKASAELQIHRIPETVRKSVTVPKPSKRLQPYSYGYELARWLRENANIPQSAPVASIEDVAIRISGKPLRVEQRNHIPGQAIRSLVGWSDNDEAIITGPNIGTEKNRFSLARSLFHVLCSCEKSQRLVTNAYTWEQSAGRGFAAELLAPQRALESRTGNRAEWSTVESLASEYRVSTEVIRRQLENAGVGLSYD